MHIHLIARTNNSGCLFSHRWAVCHAKYMPTLQIHWSTFECNLRSFDRNFNWLQWKILDFRFNLRLSIYETTPSTARLDDDLRRNFIIIGFRVHHILNMLGAQCKNKRGATHIFLSVSPLCHLLFRNTLTYILLGVSVRTVNRSFYTVYLWTENETYTLNLLLFFHLVIFFLQNGKNKNTNNRK